ncbi:hypothetical protein SAMN05443549_104267 [Flavobacterium fluvii]|uniref:DUF3108 domain-containing protein n=1 Tax=Flavobacterium fluvii TaxID=468056 RepID=A0A1M5KDB8_9FLAO|nr:DUF6134 family protein [Flavobacterium fluvii]SHG50681.1 hypothetical protein SAMN05443549_104267 [Flavobacterium fluvii]
MLVFIICTFLKKYGNQLWMKANLKTIRFFKANFHGFLAILLVGFMLFVPNWTSAQNLQLNYKIVRYGKEIGWLKLEKTTVGNTSVLLLVSEIKTKIVFPITFFSKESSTFEKGKLVCSTQIRKFNGSVKSEKQTRLLRNEYEVTANGEKEKLSFATITENLLSLYFQEPINSKWVYCDNQQCFVKVAKTDDGGYKVQFPNGNVNCFYYKEGVCVKVKIVHGFYSAEVILDPLNKSYASNR